MRKNKVFQKIDETISAFDVATISEERKTVLSPLIQYVKEKVAQQEPIHLNFICTHNSRRSHLSQIWAQTLGHYFNIKNLLCYSGGTEATAMFPKIRQTLEKQGFKIQQLSQENNPVYSVKFEDNLHPIICFSKTYDDVFNPKHGFGAIMTCDSANEACPMVVGAEKRFPITFEDPKLFDHTPQQDEKYLERSIQIGTELYYVFSNLAE